MHTYDIQNIVIDEVKGVHVVHLRFYADKDLEMTSVLQEMFQHAFVQGEFEMTGTIDILEAEDGQSFDVKVEWVGFDNGASSREPLATIWDDPPQFVMSELRKLRLDRGACLRLQTLYGITL